MVARSIVIGRILTELSWGLGARIRDLYLLDYNHLDFVWGVDAASHIYRNIIHFFRQHRWSLLLRRL